MEGRQRELYGDRDRDDVPLELAGSIMIKGEPVASQHSAHHQSVLWYLNHIFGWYFLFCVNGT